jgi:hypothetical protein
MNVTGRRGIKSTSFKTSRESAETLWQQLTLKAIPLLKGEKSNMAIEELNDLVL